MEIVNSIVEFLQGLETASAMVYGPFFHFYILLLKDYILLFEMVDYSNEACSPAFLFKSRG